MLPNGMSGIEKARKFMPDIIILDVMMPGIDGFEALGRLKKVGTATKKIPVIIFSCGKEEEEWAKKSLKGGAAGYVVKPFDSEALLFTVERFVRK